MIKVCGPSGQQRKKFPLMRLDQESSSVQMDPKRKQKCWEEITTKLKDAKWYRPPRDQPVLFRQEVPKLYVKKERKMKKEEGEVQEQRGEENVASCSMIPPQLALSDLVTAISNDDADGFYSIVENLGPCPSERVAVLLGMPEQDPGIIVIAATPEKEEFALSKGRGLIHILATPTEHLSRHLDGTEWTFGSEVVTSRIGMLTCLEELETRNKAIGLHTLTWYAKKDAKAEVEDVDAEAKAEDKEECKEAHMLDLLKAVLEMSDLDALTHPTQHHFLPIHNVAMNENSIAVSLIANRIIELMGGMGHCSDDKIQASFLQLGNKRYVQNNGPATLEKGLKRVQGIPSGCPLPHDEQGGNLNVFN
eukprot:gene25616-11269_t